MQPADINAQERVTAWVGGASDSSSWGEVANWDNGIPYSSGVSTHAIFGNSSRYMVTIGNAASTRHARSLTFDGTTPNNYVFNGAGTLIIHQRGITNERSGAVTFNNVISFEPVAQSISNQGGVLTFNNTVRATAALTIEGSGTVVFAGDSSNAIAGSFNINSGTVSLAKTGDAYALGASDLQLRGGRLVWDGGNQQVSSTARLVLSGGSAELQGHDQAFARLAIDAVNQTILDFGSDSGSTLIFEDAVYTGGTLVVRNWSSAVDWLMTSDPSAFLANIGKNLVFEGYGEGAMAVAKGESWEILPIPEPGGMYSLFSLLLIGGVAWRVHRRR